MGPIFITCGDPNGIGPEITLKALARLPRKMRVRVVLAGSLKTLLELNAKLDDPLPLLESPAVGPAAQSGCIPVWEPSCAADFTPAYGKVQAAAGRVAAEGIERGVRACLDGAVEALVTAPASKEALHLAGYHYPGQTEMISELAGCKRTIMILAGPRLRVGMVTTHLALRDVAQAINPDLVLKKITALHEALTGWFGIINPRLAVTALNPHASDGGIFGGEEKAIILPAIEKARAQGMHVEGPCPADALFPHWKHYDAIVAMYHDQGMIPIKMAALGRAINLTGGLPFPRTSPDHGTAFDIAGKGMADPSSMIRAIRMAFEFAQHMKSNHVKIP
jgi:4-hydroxythreonine-4-phosphate dehydrogenase